MKQNWLSAAGLAACTLFISSAALAQNAGANGARLQGYYGVRPWDGGNPPDALRSSSVGTTIPMSNFNITATKNGSNYSGVLVGTSPFDSTLSGSNTTVLVIPLSITIGSTTFNPSAPESCDGGATPLVRFALSPLVQNVPNLTIAGQNVGTAQYTDGFRKAEFWSLVGGNAAYSNPLSFYFGGTISLSAAAVGIHGTIFGNGCQKMGIVSNTWLDGYLRLGLMPWLQSHGYLSPSMFVIFLVHNVVQSLSNPPNILTCCILGYHGATGNPVQTYAVINWDSTNIFVGASDAAIASHEIAEWMDDPLGTNPTPAWGNVGQVLGCQSNLENGDPLSGKTVPAITMNGFSYHPQELAFFSWFFNSVATPSLGAGGKFSSNGTFAGPAKPCPPGGTN